MTIWQWAVCGCIWECLEQSIRFTGRALYYYRRGEDVPSLSQEVALKHLLGIAIPGCVFAFFGYLWNL